MQFVCEACTTKYVIPDDRVAGRVLRIRCKRCRAVMEVVGPSLESLGGKGGGANPGDLARDEPLLSARKRTPADPFATVSGSGVHPLPTGSTVQFNQSQPAFQVGEQSLANAVPPPLPPETAVAGGMDGPDVLWHVAMKGQARGPFTVEELELMAVRGRIHSRTWVWRPGMSRWARLATVDELDGVDARARERIREHVSTDVSRSASTSSRAGWDGPVAQRPGPFANLLNTHGAWLETTRRSNSPTASWLYGGSGWFALSPEAMEQVLDSPPAHAPGTSPLVTGTHLLNVPTRRLALLIGGGVAALVVALGMLALPVQMDLGAARHAHIRDDDRTPVQTVTLSVSPTADPLWPEIQALAGPRSDLPPPPPDLDATRGKGATPPSRANLNIKAIARALGTTAAKVLEPHAESSPARARPATK